MFLAADLVPLYCLPGFAPAQDLASAPSLKGPATVRDVSSQELKAVNYNCTKSRQTLKYFKERD